MSEETSSCKTQPSVSRVIHPSGRSYNVISTITQELFDSAVKYVPDSDDVFVVTYPKCGTTWLNNILYLMRNSGIPVADGDNIANHCPFLELIGGQATKQHPRPRYMKTHLYYELLPQDSKAKYFYIARNPKDTLTSFYFHTIGYDEFYHWTDGKFDDFFELFMNGLCDWGNYFEMVPKWYQQSLKQENIHFMLYEDMKTDIRKEVLRIGEFLGSTWKEKLLENNEYLLDKVLKNSSFESMKAEEDKFFYKGKSKEIFFLRKAGLGDWKNYFSREQSERIDQKMAEVSRQCAGFDKLWSKYEEFLKYE